MLILKLVREEDLPQRHRDTERRLGSLRAAETPPSRVFAYEWQTKGLRDRECARVAGKGLTGGHFCVFAHDGTPEVDCRQLKVACVGDGDRSGSGRGRGRGGSGATFTAHDSRRGWRGQLDEGTVEVQLN